MAVFGENPSLGVVIVMQKLTFCNISVITEDVYLAVFGEIPSLGVVIVMEKLTFCNISVITEDVYLAVFGEIPSLGVVIVMEKLTFCNISVITEDVYLKLGVCVQYPKSNPCYQGRQFKMPFFFQNYAPFFNLDLLSTIKHLTVEYWHPHVVLLFLNAFN